jgi:hypothetical protein
MTGRHAGVLSEAARGGIKAAKKILPRQVKSLCPECLAVISGVVHERDRQVYIEKTCPVHGPFRDIVSTDAGFYELILSRDMAVRDAEAERSTGQCPYGCGICESHLSGGIMLNIDLTNRCNLNCPVCFANAKVKGAVVELSIEQVREMLDEACASYSVRPACFQFTGGEPTVHPNFVEAIAEARRHGFAQIQIATNGVLLARDASLAHRAAEAGLNVAYLQFDGLDDEVYLKTRGARLVDVKLAAIDNLHAAGVRTVLVPTIVKGINDKQVGEILRFAVRNTGKISGISWQPVSFVGRIDYDQRVAQRFTVADLAREIEQQTGLVQMYRDWYPFSAVEPFAELLGALTGEPQQHVTCSAGCGVATYLIVSEDGNEVVPLPAFVDVMGLMRELRSLAQSAGARKGFLKKLNLARQLDGLRRFFRQEQAPSGWRFETLVEFMRDFAEFRDRFATNAQRGRLIGGTRHRSLLLASMHFMDAYNFELERIRYCVIHYAAPDGKRYPFCTYNGSPCFRDRVERHFERPWKAEDRTDA